MAAGVVLDGSVIRGANRSRLTRPRNVTEPQWIPASRRRIQSCIFVSNPPYNNTQLSVGEHPPTQPQAYRPVGNGAAPWSPTAISEVRVHVERGAPPNTRTSVMEAIGTTLDTWVTVLSSGDSSWVKSRHLRSAYPVRELRWQLGLFYRQIRHSAAPAGHAADYPCLDIR